MIERNMSDNFNINQLGYNETIPCFPQLIQIWKIIKGNFTIKGHYLVLPDDIYTKVDTYCEINSNKFPRSWYSYPNCLISKRPYVLLPFKGVVPQSQENTIDTSIDENMAHFEETVLGHQLIALAQPQSYAEYKHPMVLGTLEEIEDFIELFTEYQHKYDPHEIRWMVLNEDKDKILGEYEWPLN